MTDINYIVQQSCIIATRAAMRGNPLRSLSWLPPATASSDPRGTFLLEYCGHIPVTETPPWEK